MAYLLVHVRSPHRIRLCLLQVLCLFFACVLCFFSLLPGRSACVYVYPPLAPFRHSKRCLSVCLSLSPDTHCV
ncbi:hypothetical protein DFJ73DRAFT_851955 [Zopfochytrium polystomum]|nr:hypothetical protein DFJ73DRAFT_851955 [Zopfochytrium polystomum]